MLERLFLCLKDFFCAQKNFALLGHRNGRIVASQKWTVVYGHDATSKEKEEMEGVDWGFLVCTSTD